MLKLYLTSVVIFMIIIYCMVYIFRDAIRTNGWTTTSKTAMVNKLTGLFVFSAVPILRVVVIVCIFYMVTHTKEDFEKRQAEVKEKQNECE